MANKLENHENEDENIVEIPLKDLEKSSDNDSEDGKITCISKIIGDFGPWQRKFVIFYMLTYLIAPFQNYGIVFYSAKSDFWCVNAGPNTTLLDKKYILNKCIPNCQTYEYDKSLYYKTIINEWDLICDKSWLVSTAASVYQMGYAFSSIIVGFFSDKFGRKTTLKVIIIMEIIAGIGQALAPSIYFFLLFRFLLGIAAYGRFLTGVLLIMETVGPTKRALLSILVENSWYIGHFIMIGLYYYLPNFRYVQLIVSCIEIISIFYFDVISESIRWLLAKGKYDESRIILRKAAKENYKNIQDLDIDTKIDQLIEHFKEEGKNEKNVEKQNILTLWKIPAMLAISLCLYLCWFTNHFIAYATIFNATDFGSNLYLNMTIFTTASFFANTMLYLIIEKFNRRLMARVAYFFMFFSCFCLTISFYLEESQAKQNLFDINNQNLTSTNSSYFSNGNLGSSAVNQTVLASIGAKKEKSHWRLVFGMILKYATSTCYHVIYVLSVETFPTVMRQLAVGTCSVASRVSSITAPFTKELSNLMGLSFTFGLFTTLAVLSFTVVFFIPETRGKEIPNTINDCLIRNKEAKEKKFKKKNKSNI